MKTAFNIFTKQPKKPATPKLDSKKLAVRSYRAGKKPDRKTLELLDAIRGLKGVF